MLTTHPDSKADSSGLGVNPPSRQRMALDNLLRRELRVGDPNDPRQVADALFARYRAQPRAQAIQGEAEGIPFQPVLRRIAPAAAADTATSIDLKQAMRDVDKDLDELARNNLLKDIEAELDGWADGIRSAMAQGVDAARFGLDPSNRDRAFGIRRTLGDYARMARLIGAAKPSAIHEFRSLARSIDEVCAVILVMLGESLANNGFAGGRFLLQAPFTEMQPRRDACIHALQNLLSSLSHRPGPDEWPRGIDAYRRLFEALEAQGQGDLRALMTERELSRVLDDLVRRAAHGSAEGLRALGSTAQIELNRVYRLIDFGYRLVDPESPPLTTFLESLRLFADGFQSGGGSRLLRIARPPIVFYGLYGVGDERPSDRRIVELTVLRGRLAGAIDCFARCECSDRVLTCLILLDKLLYDIDRAVDLYAVGDQDLGLPELRASAFSYLIEAFVEQPVPADGGQPCPLDPDLRETLDGLIGLLRPTAESESRWETTPGEYEDRRRDNLRLIGADFRFASVLHQELCLQRNAEQRWRQLAERMGSNCMPIAAVFGSNGAIATLLEMAMHAVAAGTPGQGEAQIDTECRLDGPDIPADIATSLDTLVQNRPRRGGS